MTIAHNLGPAALAVLAGLLLSAACPAAAQSTIDPANALAWGENIGWVNFRPDATNGVAVTPNHLRGWAWSENAGWIHFGSGPADSIAYSQTAPDVGVNNDTLGNLTGWAWGENIGWIHFDVDTILGPRATIDSGGWFRGHAWSENTGWITLDTGNGVRTLPPPSRVADWTVY